VHHVSAAPTCPLISAIFQKKRVSDLRSLSTALGKDIKRSEAVPHRELLESIIQRAKEAIAATQGVDQA